jgi:beta-mannosidase
MKPPLRSRAFALLLIVCFGHPIVAQGVVSMNLGGTTWQVSKEGDSEVIAATVPGSIHTDLLAAKKIPDPYFGDNERKVQWVGEAAWTYRRSFDVSADLLAREHLLLRCEGLDTLATLRINGTEIGKTENMFRTYEFDVKKLLKPGANTIEVSFDSVLPYIRAKDKERHLPTWDLSGTAYIRKEPCNFGWDWGPRLITCGIWKNIALIAYDTARINDVLISQDHATSGKVGLNISVDANAKEGVPLTYKATVSLDGVEVGVSSGILQEGKGDAKITITHPKLWWPVGMGNHPLYTVKVELLDGQGRLLDTKTSRIGLRVMKVHQKTADSPMYLEVNGVKFFAKGANWIPADNFPNRIPKGRLRRYVEDAAACNMNTLRFWGGGHYEEDELLDACDELGVCLWIDFKFACSSYPAFDDAFLDNVRLEVRDNLKRLGSHPSIAVLCGNNEVMMLRDKEWSARKMGENDYYKLFRDVIGGEAKKAAPQIDYVTGSPDCGDDHFWKVWHGGAPFEAYRTAHGFMSEFGFQSFPDPKTVAAFTEPADRNSVYSGMILYHERSPNNAPLRFDTVREGIDKIMKMIVLNFREPKDFESTIWLSQINQGYGIKLGAESWRREMPRSMGCVYWQYNDIWPSISWSSVDYFGRWKALQYMAARFYGPLLVSGVEDVKEGKVDLYVTSDRMSGCNGKVAWSVTDVTGKPIKSGSGEVEIAAHSSRRVQSIGLKDEIRQWGANNLIVWMTLDVDGKRESENMVTFVHPKELELMDPKLSADIEERQGKFVVTLKAEHPALWSWLDVDGVDARCSDNFMHVTKEKPVSITISPAQPMSKEAFAKALRIRSLFDTYSSNAPGKNLGGRAVAR